MFCDCKKGQAVRQVGAENLSKPNIAIAIQERMNRRSERTQIDAPGGQPPVSGYAAGAEQA
ncbi:hypothetical protein CR157_11510 [Halomonas sp. LBP4]|nr:hypothetical protein CR157_11510 [Halomonas sp. LBP4]